MAEKKKEEKAKKAATKKVVIPPKAKPKVIVKEDMYPAIEIAETLGISQYAFHIIKRKANIQDNTFLTIKEFEALRNKIIGR